MSLQEIVDQVHAATNASRTTLRLDRPDADFPVVAEALAEGVVSMGGDRSFGVRGSATVDYLARERQILVQPDLTGDSPAPVRDLTERYGVGAQMLGPVVRHGNLLGIISVHHAGGSRTWTAAEIAAVQAGVERVTEELS